MNYISFKKNILALFLLASSFVVVDAAQITLRAPERALANRQPVTVIVFLDQEKDTLSGVSGDFSFPSDLFDVGNIETGSSVVSLWVKQPGVADEKYFDNRTHVTFEGIFPGGYSGVQSPFYEGKKPGVLFFITLIPKHKGKGLFVVDNITLNRYTADAQTIPTESVMQAITVPELLPAQESLQGMAVRVSNPALTTFITRDPLINNNAWYLVVDSPNSGSVVEKIFVAEIDEYNAEMVDENAWHTITSPYVLLHQNRAKFVHVKVLYANNTYTTRTLPPVENSQSILSISRILVSVIIVLLFALYFYGKTLFIPFKK